MRPSDARTRQKKDKLQQARNARGKVWQDDLLDILCGIPKVWCRGWPTDYSGQPYDIEATIDGRSWGIECKHIAKGNLPFSAFRPNEVENLSRKEDAGGIAVVAVRRDVPASDIYFPWYYIRDRIESGERGSVKLEGLDGELHLQDVPTPLLHQLIQELTVPNPKFQNALRLGRPTYNIPETVMLYEIKGNALTLPRGMAEEVWRARPAGTTAQVRTLKGEPVDFDTSRFSLRSYQQQAVNAALACRWCQGVLIAPCGAGKTEIGMAVIAHLGRPALWITHTLDLAQQAKERAQLRLGLDEREVAIVSGSHKRCGTKLTIATVQSLYRMELNELARTVGVVIVDECHHVVNNPEQASMFAAVLRCLPARWRFGLTASDTRSDGLSETIFQVLGPRVAVIDSQQLEQLLITPRVETVPTTFVYTPRANESPIDYIRLMRHMADDAGRMQTVERIIDRAVTEGRSWLVLAASLTILDRLHTYALNLGLAAEFVCGATKKSERTAALARMKNGQARILFATYQLAKEGLDIPCLDRLVLATPTRNKVIVQQSIGRIQRSAPGKTEALVIDLVDEKTPQLMVQYKQRRTLYKNMNITEKE